ncbi:acetyl-CoA acetyltransferase [Alicyclobacillus hesperidum URH17-3-68]|nr:acetyl-CoA acetyltransferase [Alicyclobacillus hesperidum URH17-3-68]
MRDDDFIGFFNDETQVVHPDGEEGLNTADIRTISILQDQPRALQQFSHLLVTDSG